MKCKYCLEELEAWGDGIYLHKNPNTYCAYPEPVEDHGVYNAAGHRIGSTCGCEDYPCCGH